MQYSTSQLKEMAQENFASMQILNNYGNLDIVPDAFTATHGIPKGIYAEVDTYLTKENLASEILVRTYPLSDEEFNALLP